MSKIRTVWTKQIRTLVSGNWLPVDSHHITFGRKLFPQPSCLWLYIGVKFSLVSKMSMYEHVLRVKATTRRGLVHDHVDHRFLQSFQMAANSIDAENLTQICPQLSLVILNIHTRHINKRQRQHTVTMQDSTVSSCKKFVVIYYDVIHLPQRPTGCLPVELPCTSINPRPLTRDLWPGHVRCRVADGSGSTQLVDVVFPLWMPPYN